VWGVRGGRGGKEPSSGWVSIICGNGMSPFTLIPQAYPWREPGKKERLVKQKVTIFKWFKSTHELIPEKR
jgi:hypothetical protein